jgi:hypothetical protein
MVMKMDSDDPRKEPEVDTLFAMRMKRACDANPLIPDENGGRLVWIKDRMNDEGMDVSLQSVHRWYHGRARPRQQKLLLLAKVIAVDESWLSLGRLDEIVSRRSKPQKPVLDGSVYVAIGLMQLSNISCAWPDEDDPTASYVNFYSIIQGKQHRFHVAYIRDETSEGSVKIHLPVEYEKCSIIVVRRTEPMHVDLWSLDTKTIKESSKNFGGYLELTGHISGSALLIANSTFKVMRNFDRSFS